MIQEIHNAAGQLDPGKTEKVVSDGEEVRQTFATVDIPETEATRSPGVHAHLAPLPPRGFVFLTDEPLEASDPGNSEPAIDFSIVDGREAEGMIIEVIRFDDCFREFFPELCLSKGTYTCPECGGALQLEAHHGNCSGTCETKSKTVIDLVAARNDWHKRRVVNHLAGRVGFAVSWSRNCQAKERQKELLAAALSYSQICKWKVLPLHSIENGECSCGKKDCRSPGKHPLTRNGAKDATLDEAQILEWWSWKPLANVGIATGPESGLLILDIDGDEGRQNLQELIGTLGDLPPTLGVRTGSGGQHVYLRYPSHIEVGTARGDLPPKIDVRGDGGFVVAPPSVHLSGGYYTWIANPSDCPAECPEWLLKIITRRLKAVFRGTGRHLGRRRDLIVSGLREGQRDTELTRHAGRLIARSTPLDVVEQFVIESGEECIPPFDEDQARKKVESMLKTHMNNHPDWVPPLSLKEAQQRCTQLMSEVKHHPASAVQDTYLEALEIVKQWDQETWISCKTALKGLGILRDIEKELKRRQFQVVQAAESSLVTVAQELEALSFDPPDSCMNLNMPFGYVFRPGGIAKFVETQDGPVAEEVCPSVLIPSKRFKDVSSREELVEIVYEEEGRWQTVTCPREDLSEAKHIVRALSRYGVLIHGGCAAAASRYVVDFLKDNISIIPTQHISSTLGWIEDSKTSFLLGNAHIGGDSGQTAIFRSIDGSHDLAEALREEGDYAQWKDCVALVEAYPKVLAIIYASFCAPLLQILKIPNFIVDLTWKTSVGKTTALRLAASVWGDPEKVIKSWRSTAVGLERHAGILNNLPFCIDDSAKAGDPHKITQMIYLLADGVGKLRGTRGGGIAKTFKWSTVMISNGESALTSQGNEKGGKHARVVQLRGLAFDGEDDKTRKLVDTINFTVKENFGHAGPVFIRWLIDNQDRWPEFKERYKERKEAFVKKVRNGLAARVADSVAALAIAGGLACESGALPWKESPDPFELLWPMIESELAGVEVAVKVMRDIYEWCISNQGCFRGRQGERIPPKWYGAWEAYEWKTIDIIPGVLKQALESMGHNFEGSLDALAEKQWVLVEKGRRYDRRITLMGDRVRVISLLRSGINMAESGVTTLGALVKRNLR
ncbi:MAG: DUF927 domain-containing protein [Thermodesulfobacteriota bacterium]